ncbi:MAG: hypothetical protein HYZ00_14260 [Candidatus Hydrogenedentes bacterium]|nr:hypothetical protein [Candidatus Hydrogenedentota bacterium]
MKKRVPSLAVLAAVIGLLCGCGGPVLAPVSIDVAAQPAQNISAYHLFKDAAHQIPNDGVLPYDLNTPLFTDYAAKHRFVWMPSGTAAQYNPDTAFDFPVGAVIVKTFGYLHDLRDPAKGERLIETRLLIHRQDGWIAVPYLWNETATEARLALAGARVPVRWTHNDGSERAINHIVPNVNQCKQCHDSGGKFMPLGPKVPQLNRDYDYGDGRENQLVHWARTGYLKGAPEDLSGVPRFAVWDDPTSGSVETRARAYLDSNCAHCHNPSGPAAPSGMDLSYAQTDPLRIGVNKTPVAAGRGSGGFRFGIVPGQPHESILMYRVRSTELGIMMPPLGRVSVHEEGAALLDEWIGEMNGE